MLTMFLALVLTVTPTQNPLHAYTVAPAALQGGQPPIAADSALSSGGLDFDRAFSLRRRGAVDERRRYSVRRHNLTLDRLGRVAQSTVAEGTLVRTLLREVEPGRWVERYTWQQFAFGQAMGDAAPTSRVIPTVAGLSYELVPGSFESLDAAVDSDPAGDPLTATMLKVLAMDAVSWDAAVDALRERVGERAVLGSSTTSEAWQEALEFEGTSAGRAPGSYRLGAMEVTVAGLTRFEGEPAALLHFAADANELRQTLDSEALSLSTEGREYFRGHVIVSLRDGRVLAGELWGPLVARVEVGVGGQPRVEQPVSAVLQHVWLREVQLEP